MVPDPQPEQPPTGVTRRGLLGALGLGVGGLAVGAAAGYAVASEPDSPAGGSEGAAPEIGTVPDPG